jgi:hypothetical protein
MVSPEIDRILGIMHRDLEVLLTQEVPGGHISVSVDAGPETYMTGEQVLERVRMLLRPDEKDEAEEIIRMLNTVAGKHLIRYENACDEERECMQRVWTGAPFPMGHPLQ